jgi:hypothetical protein
MLQISINIVIKMALFGELESFRKKRVVNLIKVLFRKVPDVMQENQGCRPQSLE